MASYTKKQIEVRIALASGSFGGKGTEKVIRSLPVVASIEKVAGKDKPKTKITILGLPYEDMEQLTTLAFQKLKTANNLISVWAGDEQEGLSQVFAGEITEASADFNKSPNVEFNIEAMAGYYPSLIPASPQSYAGDIAVSDIVSQQAGIMGYEFKNEGVTTRMKNCILNGSPMAKARAAANQAGAVLIVDDKQLILMPKNSERKGTTVKLTKTTGLLDYPKFNNDGIQLTAIFNKNFQLGGTIEVESIVPKATGVWKIVKMTHTLAANSPDNGKWQTEIEAQYIGEAKS